MKVYVAAPGQHNWPVIPDDIQDHLLAILSEYLNEEKLEISLKRSRTKTKILSKHPIKQHLAIGLRCVIRCIKQNQCSLVFVCTSLVPIILTKPILLLSQLHSIPSIRIKNLSTMLTKIFSIPHCSTIGFKLSCQEHEQLKNLVNNLLQIINGCEQQQPSSSSSSSVTFIPGKMISPYQNPKHSQRKLNDAISTMAGTLHRNYLRRIYGDAFNCSYRCTEDQTLDPVKFNQCVEKCSSKITQAEQAMSQEMQHVQERLMRCIQSCEDKAKDSGDKDEGRLRSIFEPCVVNCANEIHQLLPKIENRISDQLKRF
ncbi:unnamed protein product [Rotaria sp. Silwood2]|nr:unnamed protein product [Rotaria sp. Silwood2]